MHTATHTATNVFPFPVTTAHNGHTHCSTLQHSLLQSLHRKLQYTPQQIRTFFLSPQPIRDNDLPAALPRARHMSLKKRVIYELRKLVHLFFSQKKGRHMSWKNWFTSLSQNKESQDKKEMVTLWHIVLQCVAVCCSVLRDAYVTKFDLSRCAHVWMYTCIHLHYIQIQIHIFWCTHIYV